jgi:hypothetical protein
MSTAVRATWRTGKRRYGCPVERSYNDHGRGSRPNLPSFLQSSNRHTTHRILFCCLDKWHGSHERRSKPASRRVRVPMVQRPSSGFWPNLPTLLQSSSSPVHPAVLLDHSRIPCSICRFFLFFFSFFFSFCRSCFRQR